MSKIFLQNTWYWWITNDKYIATWQWQVEDITCLDYSNSKYLKCWSWFLPTTNYEEVSNYRFIQILFNKISYKSYFREDWNIKYSYDNTETNLWYNIYNVWVAKNKWFIITWNSINTWNYDEYDFYLWIKSWVTANVIIWLNTDYKFNPFIVDDTYLYIWSRYSVYVININTWTLDKTLKITYWWQIRWISQVWDNINIYANYWSNSTQFIWNWDIGSSWSYSIDWRDKQILNIATINNIDYIICSDWLYRANWYQTELLYKKPFFSYYTNCIETYQNKIYILWLWWIYSYDIWKPWFPWNLKKEIIIWDFSVNSISCMSWAPLYFNISTNNYEQDLYIAYNNYNRAKQTKNYILYYSNTNIYYRWCGWSVVLNPIPSVFWNKKSWKKVRLGYKLCTEWWDTQIIKYNNVETYYRFNHSIAILEKKDNMIFSLYIYSWVKPEVWDVYWDATVLDNSYLFSFGWWWHWWLVLNYNTEYYNFNNFKFNMHYLTKTSWVWDSTVYYCKGHRWKVIKNITDNTKNKEIFMYTGDFEELQFIIDITQWSLTTNGNYWTEQVLTKVYDFAFAYDEIENDLI